MAQQKKIDPHVKDILQLLGAGVFIGASILMAPATATLAREYTKSERKQKYEKWAKFNQWRLKQVLKRLEKQKLVECKGNAIVITKYGKTKLIQYDIETMQLDPKTDGKWRLIIYDINNFKQKERRLFRSVLKSLHFLQLQESVYLTPYKCEDEIEYLKQHFSLDNAVQVLKITGIENEQEYKKYFGI